MFSFSQHEDLLFLGRGGGRYFNLKKDEDRSSGILKRTFKRYQDIVLWACLEVVSPLKGTTLSPVIYSCFEKDYLSIGEKLTRQCRKLLWVVAVFTVA